jgi:hypothetical protein
MSLVQLKLGDMFDGPSDLIVLPCSTSGTITPFVRRQLVHHRIPRPHPGMELGDVSVQPFKGGENIAQFVAFAASVDFGSSSASAIKRIGEQLGAATIERPTIKHVSAPLLGAGAGGLQSETVVDALARGFKHNADRDARLVIHVLQDDVFKQLRKWSYAGRKLVRRPRKSPIRVFFSYSHGKPAHDRWVQELATFLRANSINVRLDIWDLRRGMDLPQFMTNELRLARRVVLISDEKYAEKADGRVGGVGWETMIIQGDILQQKPNSTKYLVVVRSESRQAGLPRYLKTKFVIHWPEGKPDERNRQTLLKELLNKVKEAPPIGPEPVSL